MACLNGDGTLTVVAGAILAAVASAGDPADIAAATGLPLYRVRGGLREMLQAGLVEALENQYTLTPRGHELLASRKD